MKDFKINDIVRVKDTPCLEWMQNTPVLPDALFKVEDIHDGKLTLSVDGSNAYFIVDAEHFELVESPDQPKNMVDMSYEPITEDDVRFDEEKARASLAAMDRLNTKWCQEELERIKSNTYSDTNFDCSNCKLADCDPKTAFLEEMQALLKRYNAYIFPCGYEVDGLSIVINDKDKIYYDMYEWSTMHDLSADNIFDYEKD